MRRLSLALGLLLVGCSAATTPKEPAAAPAPTALNGDRLGSEFLAADAETQRSYCVSSVKAYRTSGVQSFAVSPSIGNLTPEIFCQQLKEYFADEPSHQEERLSQASATAMLLYAKPRARQSDAELEGMQSGSGAGSKP